MCCIVVIDEDGMPVKVYGPFNTHTQAMSFIDTLDYEYNYVIRDMTNPH